MNRMGFAAAWCRQSPGLALLLLFLIGAMIGNLVSIAF